MMSDQQQNRGESGSDQLFQGMDEQERALAPQQVPNANMPPEEVDRGGTAGQAAATLESGSAASERETIAGAEGDQRTTTIVGVRPDVSANAPTIALPAANETRDPDADRSTRSS